MHQSNLKKRSHDSDQVSDKVQNQARKLIADLPSRQQARSEYDFTAMMILFPAPWTNLVEDENFQKLCAEMENTGQSAKDLISLIETGQVYKAETRLAEILSANGFIPVLKEVIKAFKGASLPNYLGHFFSSHVAWKNYFYATVIENGYRTLELHTLLELMLTTNNALFGRYLANEIKNKVGNQSSQPETHQLVQQLKAQFLEIMSSSINIRSDLMFMTKCFEQWALASQLDDAEKQTFAALLDELRYAANQGADNLFKLAATGDIKQVKDMLKYLADENVLMKMFQLLFSKNIGGYLPELSDFLILLDNVVVIWENYFYETAVNGYKQCFKNPEQLGELMMQTEDSRLLVGLAVEYKKMLPVDNHKKARASSSGFFSPDDAAMHDNMNKPVLSRNSFVKG